MRGSSAAGRTYVDVTTFSHQIPCNNFSAISFFFRLFSLLHIHKPWKPHQPRKSFFRLYKHMENPMMLPHWALSTSKREVYRLHAYSTLGGWSEPRKLATEDSPLPSTLSQWSTWDEHWHAVNRSSRKIYSTMESDAEVILSTDEVLKLFGTIQTAVDATTSSSVPLLNKWACLAFKSMLQDSWYASLESKTKRRILILPMVFPFSISALTSSCHPFTNSLSCLLYGWHPQQRLLPIHPLPQPFPFLFRTPVHDRNSQMIMCWMRSRESW